MEIIVEISKMGDFPSYWYASNKEHCPITIRYKNNWLVIKKGEVKEPWKDSDTIIFEKEIPEEKDDFWDTMSFKTLKEVTKDFIEFDLKPTVKVWCHNHTIDAHYHLFHSLIDAYKFCDLHCFDAYVDKEPVIGIEDFDVTVSQWETYQEEKIKEKK